MVYRELLVTPHRIYLHCHRHLLCEHRTSLTLGVLRVCRQISNEALDVFYGENDFCFQATPDPQLKILINSEANQDRLRRLSIEHPFTTKVVNADPEDGTEDFDSDDDITYVTDDDDPARERTLCIDWHSPLVLRTNGWRPILSRLTQLTIVVTVDCCIHRLRWGSIVSRDKARKDYAARRIKRPLDFYNDRLPTTATVKFGVRCDAHDCLCRLKNQTCANVHKYVKDLLKRIKPEPTA